ncbi:MAG: SIMPL domain-containing protein [Flavobacteriales bacterium]|nr:SIMPL domain-containing protein [Flavobacteriales bacterium]
MKSNLLPSLLLGISIIIGGYLIGDMHKKAKVYDRHVEVKGLAEREVEADLAVWPLELNLADNSLNALNSKLDNQKSRVNAFFKELGFTENEISMGVSSIIDRQASEYASNQNFSLRFFGKAEITLRTTDLKKIQLALEKSLALTSEGILINSKNGWRPIEYIFTGLNDIKPEMIEEATVKAKEVAEKFAKDSNSKVGKIRSANQGLFTISDRDPSTPQVKKVRVATVEYLLED